MEKPPTHLSIPDFSAHIGCKRNYAYQLKKEGRLVLTEDGKSVKVAESIARIAATRDPAHKAVADRHATDRGTTAQTGHASSAPDAPPAGEGAEGPLGYDFQTSKAKREHWAAEREHADFRKEAGELIELTKHMGAMANIGSLVRTKLEAWSTTLAPQLIGLDESAIQARLASEVEHILGELDAAARHLAAQEAE